MGPIKHNEMLTCDSPVIPVRSHSTTSDGPGFVEQSAGCALLDGLDSSNDILSMKQASADLPLITTIEASSTKEQFQTDEPNVMSQLLSEMNDVVLNNDGSAASRISITHVDLEPENCSNMRLDLTALLALLPGWLYASLYTRVPADHLQQLHGCILHQQHPAQFFFASDSASLHLNKLSEAQLAGEFNISQASLPGAAEPVLVLMSTRSVGVEEVTIWMHWFQSLKKSSV